MRNKKQMRSELKQRQEEIWSHQKSIVCATDKSTQIYKNKLKRKLVKIFRLLDANENGKITADEIELEYIPS